MFSYVSPKRNLPYMLDEVNMKSGQREHPNIQVKRKKWCLPLQRMAVLFVVGSGEEKEQETRENEWEKGGQPVMFCDSVFLPYLLKELTFETNGWVVLSYRKYRFHMY